MLFHIKESIQSQEIEISQMQKKQYSSIVVLIRKNSMENNSIKSI